MIENPSIRTLLRKVEELNAKNLNIYLQPDYARRLYSLAYILQDLMFLKYAATNLQNKLKLPQIEGEKDYLEAENDAQ